MYDRRLDRRHSIDPAALGTAVALNGGVILLLIFAAPTMIHRDPPPGAIVTRNIPLPVEPEPVPQPEPKASPEARVVDPSPAPRPPIPEPIVPTGAERRVVAADPLPPLPPTGIYGSGGTGTGTGPVAADPPAPVLTGVRPDPRHADAFQPTYPEAERRIERPGRVVVRVLVGTDGRVKAIERVSATSDSFFEATRRRALSHWRFQPATRDGVAQESWYRMSVTFTIDD